MIVGINCGHTVSGTVGSGAVGYLNESDETRNVGYKVMEILRARGVTVVDCTDDRSATVQENLSKIVAMANAQPLDLFVSIHFNSGGGKGCEVYTYGGQKLEQATAVCENLAERGFVNRGIKDGSNLYVVRRSDSPAMLIEVCFVDTKSDADLYNSLGAAAIAEAIADGITGDIEKEELTMTQYEELNERLQALEKPMIYNYIDSNMPEWAKEAVQWCVDNGIIVGTGGGLNLDDTKLWVCVVIYRLQKLL